MREVPLTQGKVALVDDCDYERVMQYRWFAHYKGTNWYAAHQVGKRGIRLHMHRFILDAPASVPVDHIDQNGLHNWRDNLRLCTPTGNSANRRKYVENGSVFKGIYRVSTTTKWRAKITVGYETIHIGYFVSELDAAKAYNEAATRYFGEFASLNDV